MIEVTHTLANCDRLATWLKETIRPKLRPMEPQLLATKVESVSLDRKVRDWNWPVPFAASQSPQQWRVEMSYAEEMFLYHLMEKYNTHSKEDEERIRAWIIASRGKKVKKSEDGGWQIVPTTT